MPVSHVSQSVSQTEWLMDGWMDGGRSRLGGLRSIFRHDVRSSRAIPGCPSPLSLSLPPSLHAPYHLSNLTYRLTWSLIPKLIPKLKSDNLRGRVGAGQGRRADRRLGVPILPDQRERARKRISMRSQTKQATQCKYVSSPHKICVTTASGKWQRPCLPAPAVAARTGCAHLQTGGGEGGAGGGGGGD